MTDTPAIDSSSIQPGQRVHFQCPGCQRGFWKTWQLANNSADFQDVRCYACSYLHPIPLIMEIDKVEDVPVADPDA